MEHYTALVSALFDSNKLAVGGLGWLGAWAVAEKVKLVSKFGFMLAVAVCPI